MPDAEPRPGEVFDVDRIRRLVELMKEYELAEIDLRQEDQRIRLSRGGKLEAATAVPPPAPPAPPPGPAAAGAAAEAAPAGQPEEAHVVAIKSPMVGTFYGRPNPKAEPFVKVGDHVDPETTICIIEAMKVFNEIPAEVRGRIVAVLADDEEPVEFGKPLFKVDTSK